jgi:hypothetical protein
MMMMIMPARKISKTSNKINRAENLLQNPLKRIIKKENLIDVDF